METQQRELVLTIENCEKRLHSQRHDQVLAMEVAAVVRTQVFGTINTSSPPSVIVESLEDGRYDLNRLPAQERIKLTEWMSNTARLEQYDCHQFVLYVKGKPLGTRIRDVKDWKPENIGWPGKITAKPGDMLCCIKRTKNEIVEGTVNNDIILHSGLYTGDRKIFSKVGKGTEYYITDGEQMLSMFPEANMIVRARV